MRTTTTTATEKTSGASAEARVRKAFDRLLEAYRREPVPSYETRMERLERAPHPTT